MTTQSLSDHLMQSLPVDITIILIRYAIYKLPVTFQLPCSTFSLEHKTSPSLYNNIDQILHAVSDNNSSLITII